MYRVFAGEACPGGISPATGGTGFNSNPAAIAGISRENPFALAWEISIHAARVSRMIGLTEKSALFEFWVTRRDAGSEGHPEYHSGQAVPVPYIRSFPANRWECLF